jgi:hypothetical protein
LKTSASEHRARIAVSKQGNIGLLDLVSRVFEDFISLANPRKDLHMTKNLLKYSLVVLGLALGACASAHGMVLFKKPEVDPGLAISGLTLLAGTIAVLRVRRQK